MTGDSAPVSFSLAFLAGFLTFASPCIFPLIPAYISYITGISFDELREAKLMKILGLRFVFVYMKSEIYPVAIPVFLKDMSELIDVLESLIGTEHFLTLELNKAIH